MPLHQRKLQMKPLLLIIKTPTHQPHQHSQTHLHSSEDPIHSQKTTRKRFDSSNGDHGLKAIKMLDRLASQNHAPSNSYLDPSTTSLKKPNRHALHVRPFRQKPVKTTPCLLCMVHPPPWHEQVKAQQSHTPQPTNILNGVFSPPLCSVDDSTGT
ncbi:hypothetical protein BC829DRAFT_221633 [Chytridium lagenaria]|nr:hypothetical protein BC829DRAFT_221633 [Chytridium lagenaria]